MTHVILYSGRLVTIATFANEARETEREQVTLTVLNEEHSWTKIQTKSWESESKDHKFKHIAYFVLFPEKTRMKKTCLLQAIWEITDKAARAKQKTWLLS